MREREEKEQWEKKRTTKSKTREWVSSNTPYTHGWDEILKGELQYFGLLFLFT